MFYTNPGYGWYEAKGARRMCKGGALAVRRVWKASLLPELPSEPGPVLVFLCVYVFVEQIRSSVSECWGLLNIKKSRGTTHTDIHTHEHRALIYTRIHLSLSHISHSQTTSHACMGPQLTEKKIVFRSRISFVCFDIRSIRSSTDSTASPTTCKFSHIS